MSPSQALQPENPEDPGLDISFAFPHERPTYETIRSNPVLDIAEKLVEGGSRLHALHRAVHDFRKAHGAEEWLTDPSALPTPQYLACLQHYIDLTPRLDDQTRQAIERLSEPSAYNSCRNRGRMRASYPQLKGESLTLACREIAASLTWKALGAETISGRPDGVPEDVGANGDPQDQSPHGK